MRARSACGLLLAAAVVAPCSGFVPQGVLRSSQIGSPVFQGSGPSDVVDEKVPLPMGATGTSTAAAFAILAMAAGGLAIGSARSERKTASKGPCLIAMRSIEDGFCMRQYGKEIKMSPACPFMEYPYQLEGWVGGQKGFDPLGVTDALPVYFTREAELKHGRVCMLATLGWIATDLGARFPGEVFQKVEGPLTAHDRMSDAGIMLPFASIIGAYELYGMWLFLQGYEGKINRDAGDFYFGKSFLPKESSKADEMRLKELENGRLAMLAFSGIVTVAAAFPDKHFPYV